MVMDICDTTDSAIFRLSPPIISVHTQSSRSLFLLGALSDKYDLVEQIEVSVEVDELDQFVVSDNIFFMYGVGKSVQEAVRDYKSSLTEYYDIYEDHTDAPTADMFEFIKTYIKKN